VIDLRRLAPQTRPERAAGGSKRCSELGLHSSGQGPAKPSTRVRFPASPPAADVRLAPPRRVTHNSSPPEQNPRVETGPHRQRAGRRHRPRPRTRRPVAIAQAYAVSLVVIRMMGVSTLLDPRRPRACRPRTRLDESHALMTVAFLPKQVVEDDRTTCGGRRRRPVTVHCRFPLSTQRW
jgi:hypothetical protein